MIREIEFQINNLTFRNLKTYNIVIHFDKEQFSISIFLSITRRIGSICCKQLREQHQEHLQKRMQEGPSTGVGLAGVQVQPQIYWKTLHREDSETYQAVHANDQSAHQQHP